jgi:hypothetical protein
VTPFCPVNTITRIEAAAILLRYANVWNDTMNGQPYERRFDFTDVNDRWYGYAQKGIEIGILSLRPNNTILPDEAITRAEFIRMAADIFELNFCAGKNQLGEDNDISAIIRIYDKESTTSSQGRGLVSTFPNPSERVYDVYGTSESVGDFIYSWQMYHPSLSGAISASGQFLDNFSFPQPGRWIVRLTVRDPKNSKTANAYATIMIRDPANTDDIKKTPFLTVGLLADPIYGVAPLPVKFTSVVGGVPPGDTVTYAWSFGEG